MSAIRKIIFLKPTTTMRRDFERYSVSYLAGFFKVEIWDLSGLLYPESARETEHPDAYVGPEVRMFRTQDSLESALQCENGSSVAISMIGFGEHENKIWNRFLERGVLTGILSSDAQPHSRSTVDRAKDSILRILHSAKQRLDDRSGQQPGMAGFVIAGGYKTPSRNLPVGRKTAVIRIHAMDYDICLAANPRPEKLPDNYGVFLDEYMPFHPDYSLYGIAAPVASAESYYSGLRQVLSQIEENLGFPIIIAAHPRADYSRHSDYFGGRQIITGATQPLVRDSKVVIAHNSKSVNFAVVHGKPVLLVHIPAGISADYRDHINALARSLGKKALDPDNLRLDRAKLMEINKGAYAKHFENYIKIPGTPEQPLWVAFVQYLLSRR